MAKMGKRAHIFKLCLFMVCPEPRWTLAGRHQRLEEFGGGGRVEARCWDTDHSSAHKADYLPLPLKSCKLQSRGSRGKWGGLWLK